MNCDVCGRRMQANAKWGVCIFTLDCRQEFNRRRRHPEGQKKCEICGGTLWANNITGVCRRTRECARDRDLRKNFGITLEQYNDLLTAQDGRCAICHRHGDWTGRRLAVDHNHATGKVRGLLCGSCNRGIGFLDEDIKVLEGAIAYLLLKNGR
jgi:Recombination endonuclease VII